MSAPLTHPPLYTARFNKLIRSYLLLSVAGMLVFSVIGIPLAIIWLLGVGQWWSAHYFDKLMCELDSHELRFRKGILFTVEKTIPLENIQDVTFIEGPLLRQFDLSVLRFETAGQGAGQANDMRLIGIINAQKFRDLILQRRNEARARQNAPAAAQHGDGEQLALLRSIDARLQQIVDKLGAQG